MRASHLFAWGYRALTVYHSTIALDSKGARVPLSVNLELQSCSTSSGSQKIGECLILILYLSLL